MNLDEIDKKCFILALFIRDDGQRFLLGSGAYEFKDSQLHFSANTMSNDVVEVQGNDGYLLAGQVRRPTTQVFDGYIGDASINKPDIEGYRRDFFAFFQKNHFYTVVYIFPDGTAIQRRRGFIVDASEVRELYQMFPEYHIGLNFEDVNYYKYAEDEDGHEQYAKSIDINISKAVSGGLIWDSVSQTQAYNHGTDFSINGTIENEPVDHIDLYGDTEQTTYSGKNLYNKNAITANVIVRRDNGTTSGNNKFSASDYIPIEEGQQYTFTNGFDRWYSAFYDSNKQYVGYPTNTQVITVPTGAKYIRLSVYNSSLDTAQFEKGNQATSFEPYVGGTASPNPDYPQEVKTVTGEQTITVSDGQGNEQEYKVNLGGEEFYKENISSGYLTSSGVHVSDNGWALTDYMPVEAGRDYVYSGITLAGNAPYSGYYDSNKTFVSSFKQSTGTNTITIPSGVAYVRVSLRNTSPNIDIDTFSFKLDGVDIELCKIGTYQDYIYSVNGDYYLHKEVEKQDMSALSGLSVISTGNFIASGFASNYGSVIGEMLSNIFTYSATGWEQVGKFGIAASGNLWAMTGDSTITTANIATWLANKGAVVYYALATPTDTQITNADLIAQLEALNSATTYAGATWFKTESEYLPADTWAYVQIQAGGGVVWDNYGATWEEGGGGMIVNVNVDSIENVYPVWTVTGPTDTPILTNLTTGTSITYNGNITASQTLVVDMLNQTALLNGTSVIGKLSGDWIELAPGMNRMSYTATNEQTAPKSTLEWQEIVG